MSHREEFKTTQEEEKEVKKEFSDDDLWDSDPDCDHEIVSMPGGGIRCNKCSGWLRYFGPKFYMKEVG